MTAAATLARLCGGAVATAMAEAKTALPPWPEEADAVIRAVPARRAEFAGGRAAARAAIASLGLDPVPIPMGPDRAPRWPVGLVGSIAHDRGLCLAAVGRRSEVAALGIDLEPAAPLDPALADEIASTAEQDAAGDAGPLALRRIFSAKEAVYKAQYPLSGLVLEFADLSVTLAPGGFDARFLRRAGPIPEGAVWAGRQALGADRIVTAFVMTI